MCTRVSVEATGNVSTLWWPWSQFVSHCWHQKEEEEEKKEEVSFSVCTWRQGRPVFIPAREEYSISFSKSFRQVLCYSLTLPTKKWLFLKHNYCRNTIVTLKTKHVQSFPFINRVDCEPLCLSLLSHLFRCGAWSSLFYLAGLGLCWVLKIALSPSSHLPSGIWASGLLVMYFIFHEYLTRILQGSWALQKILFRDLLQCTLIHQPGNTHARTLTWNIPAANSQRKNISSCSKLLCWGKNSQLRAVKRKNVLVAGRSFFAWNKQIIFNMKPAGRSAHTAITGMLSWGM